MRLKNMAGCLLILLVLAGTSMAAFPKPTGHVNDFAGVVPADAEARMEALCRDLKTKTGAEIAVATFKDLGGEDYNEFANKLFAAWGIGGKKDDSGVLILFALKERKMRIETGYGKEGDLPDALCGRIRDEYMLPHFRTGNFGRGLYAGTAVAAQVIAKAKGVTLAGVPSVRRNARRAGAPRKATFGQKVMSVLFVMFMIYMFIKHPRMMILMLLMSGRGGRGGGSWGGGGGGFGGGFGGFGGGSSGGGGAGGGW